MMIILHGDTIEQLTFILSESRAALAVTNLGCGSRQPHTEQLHYGYSREINVEKISNF